MSKSELTNAALHAKARRDAAELTDALRDHAKTERKQQSKRALLILFVLCPSVAIGAVLLLRVMMMMEPPL